jgi:hypothetical protein
MPSTRTSCEACGHPLPPLPDRQCPTLCNLCCSTIDRDTEARLEEEFWGPGPFGDPA